MHGNLNVKLKKKTPLTLWPCPPKNATQTVLGLNTGIHIHTGWQVAAWAMAQPTTKARKMKQMRHIHKQGLCEMLQNFSYEVEKTIIRYWCQWEDIIKMDF